MKRVFMFVALLIIICAPKLAEARHVCPDGQCLTSEVYKEILDQTMEPMRGDVDEVQTAINVVMQSQQVADGCDLEGGCVEDGEETEIYFGFGPVHNPVEFIHQFALIGMFQRIQTAMQLIVKPVFLWEPAKQLAFDVVHRPTQVALIGEIQKVSMALMMIKRPVQVVIEVGIAPLTQTAIISTIQRARTALIVEMQRIQTAISVYRRPVHVALICVNQRV